MKTGGLTASFPEPVGYDQQNGCFRVNNVSMVHSVRDVSKVYKKPTALLEMQNGDAFLVDGGVASTMNAVVHMSNMFVEPLEAEKVIALKTCLGEGTHMQELKAELDPAAEVA